MDLLKRNKTAQRSSFTKVLNKLEQLLASDTIEYDEIETYLGLFKQKADTLEITHNAYLDSLEDTKIFENEYESVENYREQAVRITLKAQRFLDNLKNKNIENKISSVDSSPRIEERVSKTCQYRLPEVEFYKYGGQLKDWLSFWNQFKNIHENENLTDVDKFNYLIQSTKIGSEARELVESYPVTNENYSLAIESLKERFGQDDLLIDFYIRELLKLVLNNANKNKPDSLSSLYNKLSTQIRALGSLGVKTEMCSIILYPLVESALPVHILRSFERHRNNSEIDKNLSKLDTLIEFLKSEVHAEEKIKLSRTEIHSFAKERKHLATSQNPTYSASELISHETNSVCVFCLKDHESRFCKKAFYMTLKEKYAIIKQKGLCRSCLIKGHMSFSCRSNIKCPLCSKSHVKFLCPNLENNKNEGFNHKESNNENKEKVLDSLHSRVTNEVFLQTLVVNVEGKNKKRRARIIFDTGSSKSYILKTTAAEMGFNLQGEEEFTHSLFGGTKTKMFKHKCYKIYLSSLDGNYTCKLDALDQDVICNDISSIKYGSWIRELKNKGIRLSDTEKNAGPIEILLGADVVGKLLTGRKEDLKTGLVALHTKLGWTLMGKVPQLERQANTNMSVVSMFIHEDLPVTSLWDLELLGIRDPVEQTSREESRKALMMHFQETVSQTEDGRYKVHMPWKENHASLPDNYELSKKRLESTTKKLEKTGYRAKYHEVFQEWIRDGVIEEVPKEELLSPVSHYLPHRPVIKETSVTSSLKVRPVFDASAKILNHPSLNDCLETGINLIETIPSILARFRLNEIGVISDIKRAFLQISVQEKDRDFLRFLWYDVRGVITPFRHRRIVFGLTSSPFLLMAVIHHHLSKESLRVQYSAELLEKLRDSFYVDNCVTSVQNIFELENFIEAATDIMEKGKFELRGWESNALSICPSETLNTNVLGLIWDKNSDTLEIDSELLKFDKTDKLTKRKILSLISKIFDPTGYIAPALIEPKILLQAIWKTKENWDAEVSDEIKRKFLKWFKDLHYLKDIKIPRWVGATETSDLSLHTFVDASKNAYSACIFLRCESTDGLVNVQLLQAKSRITPLKKITIPRLELMGAVIGARLFKSVKDGLKVENIEAYFWTDSSTVLSWIKRQEQWSVFVNNRISEIRKLTFPKNWSHISGELNPADLSSRGCSAKQLLKSQWWLGPDWLKSSREQWPKSIVNANEEEIAQEKRRTVISAYNTESESVISRLAKRVSKFSKIVRILAWILRFRPQAKDVRKCTDITDEEISNAQRILFRCVQSECFSGEEGKKSLVNFQVFKDDDALLRLKSRLMNEDEAYNFIFPLILPSKHPIVKRIIEQEHILNKHAGTSTLILILREKYWILKGKKTIRSVINECIICKKQKVKHLEVPFPPLPQDRTRLSAVFQVSGVDLAGPLLTKSKEKVWIVLFSCAVFRAVHLELIPSLSTGAFIQALRRFIARRGRISVLYSDNGTNFTGLNSALKSLDWTEIQRKFEIQEIRWKFNPPSAPWWGGFWERLIRILKDLLRKNLGRSCLNYEELLTLVCECEAVMNNRPLTYVSEEPELRTLTPALFLHDLSISDVPDLDQVERTNIVKRLRYIQKLRENLKQRFKREYLGFLRSSAPKRHDEIKIGDVVLIGKDEKNRLNWPLAKVVELYPGKDGIVRVVKVKTQKGDLLRPIQRLYPLECDLTFSSMQPTTNTGNGTVTRSGRVVKTVNRLTV